ncbi:hypothetical protein GK047_04810 [Paenibacillus sp. SYP-B3998]|uniref:Uncharacterized protein n=1 Tax=Paenibacillus sp. SYP-B3998 TaxID=2678564 RepID=A0A6G3ZV93_9BACL|nr:hypothetical protein [Paenibacillus sp. SYP-B3998]NEW05337.1 hypothetical protein [Paenibacillus sp. SYP-B3998]
MAQQSPQESMHALNFEGLKKPKITFWSVWEQDELVGGGTLKELDDQHGVKNDVFMEYGILKGIEKFLKPSHSYIKIKLLDYLIIKT